MTHSFWQAFVICLAVGVAGCGNTPTRTTDQIFSEKQSRPRLYLTRKTKTHVIAPADKGMFVDANTREECWPALECTNPNCPGRQGDTPSLFTAFDVSDHGGCPACAKIRPKSESEADKQKYLKFVRPYELPEVREQLKRLDAEFERATKAAAKAKS